MEILRHNNFHVMMLLVVLKGSVFRDSCFLDGGFNKVAVDTTAVNIRVDLDGDPSALLFWCGPGLASPCLTLVDRSGILVSRADKCITEWAPVGFQI